jgi:hypothetical protein
VAGLTARQPVHIFLSGITASRNFVPHLKQYTAFGGLDAPQFGQILSGAGGMPAGVGEVRIISGGFCTPP